MYDRAAIISMDALSQAAQVGVGLAMDDRAAALAISTTEPIVKPGTCTTGYHPPDPTSGTLVREPTTMGMYPTDPIVVAVSGEPVRAAY